MKTKQLPTSIPSTELRNSVKKWGGGCGTKEYKYFFKGMVPFDLQSLVLSTVAQGQPYHYA